MAVGREGDFVMPVEVRICVRGEMPEGWSDRLGGLTSTAKAGPGQDTVTLLSGTLPDQPALMGVLSTLHDLRLMLMSLETRADLTKVR